MQRRPKHNWEVELLTSGHVFSAQQEDSKDAGGGVERNSVVISLVALVPMPGASQWPKI